MAITIIPFMEVVTISVSPPSVASEFGLHLIPKELDFSGYKKVFGYGQIWRSYMNTIVRTLIGSALSLVLYIIGAYPLSKKNLPHRKFWTLFIVFTMYFSGGLIPSYLLVNNILKISNTLWALVLPPAMSAYTVIIVRNFFESIPDELDDSAKIDGANDITTLSVSWFRLPSRVWQRFPCGLLFSTGMPGSTACSIYRMKKIMCCRCFCAKY